MRNSAVAQSLVVPTSRLDIQQIKVRELVEQYRVGHLVIPEFQREYVWKPNRAPRLMDSLYRGYPVSVLLVWTSDAELRARRPDPRPLLAKATSWLIDGQQRVITLSRILSGDDGIDVVFHPEEERFRLTNATSRPNGNWFRVSELLDDKAYRQLRRALPEDARGHAREAKFDRVRRILDYEIPAVRMIDHSFDEAVEAFTRINTLGVKLKLEDLASAHVAARHSGFIADEVAPFISKLLSRGFPRLSISHLFRVCAFVATPDGRARTPLYALSLSEVTQAWTRTKKATEEALALIRDEFGFVNMDILWSGALLVPVIALCAILPEGERDSRAIAGWLALAAMSHRYTKGLDPLDQDLKACRADDPIGRLLANVRKDDSGLLATPSDFRSRWHDKGVLFGVYTACRHMGMLDVFTGAAIPPSPNVERHYILPRAQFAPRKRSGADTVANIAFVNGDSVLPVGTASPEFHLGRLSRDVLNSQCIPTHRELWRIEKSEELWEARRSLLASAFNDFVKSRLPGRRI